MDCSLNSPGSKKNGLPRPRRFCLTRNAGRPSEARLNEVQRQAKMSDPPALITPNPEVVPDAKRRIFTLEYKLRILREAEAAKQTPGGVGALLRREGLYSSHLTTWRKEREAGGREALKPKTRGPKPKHDPQQQELERLSAGPCAADNRFFTAATPTLPTLNIWFWRKFSRSSRGCFFW